MRDFIYLHCTLKNADQNFYRYTTYSLLLNCSLNLIKEQLLMRSIQIQQIWI